MDNPYHIDNELIMKILVEGCETQLYEFKTTLLFSYDEDRIREKELRSEFVKDFLALANTAILEGRRTLLFIGVSNSGDILGLSEEYDDSQFQSFISSLVIPRVNFLFVKKKLENREIGLFIILPYGEKIFTIKKNYTLVGGKNLLKEGTTWIREGTSKKEIRNVSEILDLQSQLDQKVSTRKQLIEEITTELSQDLVNNVEIKWSTFTKTILDLEEHNTLKLQRSDLVNFDRSSDMERFKSIRKDSPNTTILVENNTHDSLFGVRLILEFPESLYVYHRSNFQTFVESKNKKALEITDLARFYIRNKKIEVFEEESGTSIHLEDEHNVLISFEKIEYLSAMCYPTALLVGGFQKGKYEVNYSLTIESLAIPIRGSLEVEIS